MTVLDEFLSKTPDEIQEVMKIKGIEAEKISIIWKEMEIENIGNLLYACHERRLSMWKDFGKKIQDNVVESIEFYRKQHGNYSCSQVEQLALNIEALLYKIIDTNKIRISGSFAKLKSPVLLPTYSYTSYIANHNPIIISQSLCFNYGKLHKKDCPLFFLCFKPYCSIHFFNYSFAHSKPQACS